MEVPYEARRNADVVKKGNNVQRSIDSGMMQMIKLSVECRRAHLKAFRPQRWGDVSTLITKDGDGFDTSSLSPEELEAQIADIEHKSAYPALPEIE